ncbi:DUF551 domain-containing protein [Cronobacter sakazakii]|nr:DUF551 domain-containing protein [Cronobacter sakazakii]
MSEISEAIKQKAAEMESENDLITIPRGLLGAAQAVIKRPERDSANVIELLRYYAFAKEAPVALRERAEPVAVVNSNMRRICKKCSASIVGYSVDGLCEDCYLAAPPAPVVADDSLPYDPQIAEYEQMMEAEQAETDTTSQQFESLAGKAVSGSEGFECTPVADLYELLTKCGECYDYTTSAKVAADWIKEGYSAREYVKLDRLQEAMTQGSPGEADGWIPCSERMPENDGNYWAWWSESKRQGPAWFIKSELQAQFQSSEITHWMPLPEAPAKN